MLHYRSLQTVRGEGDGDGEILASGWRGGYRYVVTGWKAFGLQIRTGRHRNIPGWSYTHIRVLNHSSFRS